MFGMNQNDIHTHIIRTRERLQEIQAGSESRAQKQARASVNLCSLLEEIAAASLPLDTQNEITELTELFMDIQ